MKTNVQEKLAHLSPKQSHLGPFLFIALACLMSILFVRGTNAQPPNITLVVREYVAGAPPGTGPLIAEFDYLINEDNSGDPFDPDPNQHPSLKHMASYSPVVGLGSETAPGEATLTLVNGRYLASVRADGYKLGGQHIVITDTTGAITVLVELVKDPLPLAQVRVHVFRDNFPVNGEDDVVLGDAPREPGLEGFRVIVESGGEVTVDWYGNPICTEYDGVGASTPLGDPIPGTGGVCFTDANGDAIIPNLPRGKYETLTLPPDGEDNDWIQTTTIEGTHIIDAWAEEGDQGFSPREGFQQAMVWVGFVQRCAFGDTADSCPTNDTAGTGTIMGTVKTIVEWTPPYNPVQLGEPMFKPWIALTDIGNNDRQVYLGQGDADGNFTVSNVPAGTYQMAIWDDPLDYIMGFRTVTVAEGEIVSMGDVGVPRWFGWLAGYVFLDDGLDASGTPQFALIAGNSIRDCVNPADESTCERPIDGIPLATRYRDGSIQYGTLTDNYGYYEFPEVKELEKFAVIEVDFGRFGFTGASVHNEFDYSQTTPYEGVLTLSNLTWAAKRSQIDWGKFVYGPGENGGISGIVFFATTRNETDLRFSGAEDYEPGVPNVTVRLYDATGTVLLNEVQTDAFEHPANCDYTDSDGVPQTDPLGLGTNCIEVPNISNEVKEGLFDGGYAFETMFPAGYPSGAEVPLPPGDYVVEVVSPAFMKAITVADINTSDGEEYDPPPGLIAPPCANGDCSRRLVTLQAGHNAGAEFFLMTANAVPMPGRIYGFLLDDVNVETDPNRIYFGEKRGIPFTPVGIRDFTGRLIATVHSDENGIFEVLLPSTHTANCPTPAGVCPAMYRVVANDPGDPTNPNPDYNPNYQSLTFIFDVWPGKTTYADVATFPITAFVEFPGGQYGQPAQCITPDGMPEFWYTSKPYSSGGETISLYGKNFGPTAGEVLANGTPIPSGQVTWISDGEVAVTIPTGMAAGRYQLLVRSANGQTSQTGITFHKIGAGYSPTVVVVTPDPLGTPLQDAIAAATSNTLIIATPGMYFENLLLDKAGVKLQGHGPGQPNGFGTGGSVLDERFTPGTGLIVTAAAPGTFSAAFNPQIDGFRIAGGRDEGSIGGAVFAETNAENLEISNNVIQSNGGNLGGGIVLGEPYEGDMNNDNVHIHHNRILNNGGISLAGGLAIFNGADGYEIDHNEICGNYSAEYGGGISHFGLSHDGSIHHNRLYYNNAFDEGGAIMVAGEQFCLPQPADGGVEYDNPCTEDPGEIVMTVGSGALAIYNNLIQANLSNDDGGAIRLLQPWDYPIDIYNNIIANNVATDFGGGVSMDDASDVWMLNNTIVRNTNTATAEDSDGLPHGGALVVEPYSNDFETYLIDTYGSAGVGFPDPYLRNNLIWDNQAFTWDGVALTFNSVIDLEVFGGGTFTHAADPSNLIGTDPGFVDDYTTTLGAVAFRQEPNFVTVFIVTVNIDGTLPGDYHLASGSPAIDAGTTMATVTTDYDDEGRPQGLAYDIGADEAEGTGEPPVILYFSTASNTTPPGVVDGDNANIYTWNGYWFDLFFNASGAGGAGLPGGADVDGLFVEDSDTLYLSFKANGGTSVPGVGTVQDEDVVRYDAGTWTMYFDGSDAGVDLDDSANEDIDAFSILGDGSVVISTVGSASVPGAAAVGHDSLRCVGTFGPATTCTWSVYVDGSDIGLSSTSTAQNENLDGVAFSGGNLYLSTVTGYSVASGSFSGGGDDVWICQGAITGTNTSCPGGFVIFYDGSGLAANDLDAFALP